MAHWSTELTHILFFVTAILILGILEIGHMDSAVVFAYSDHGIHFTITIYDVLLGTILLMLVAIGWLEYKREELERLIEEYLRGKM